MPTLCPGYRQEAWEKGVRKVGKARECPPFAQTIGRKGGKRIVKRRGKHQKSQTTNKKNERGIRQGRENPPFSVRKYQITNTSK